ncbi:MAG TPA: hypothetical protein PJ986_13395 [Gammaproteobacteria bacterium]|nr:hypothetical protein [Gammaproteobacteria bacterium]
MKKAVFAILGLALLLAAGEAIVRQLVGLRPGAPIRHDALSASLLKFVEFDPVLGLRYRPNIDQLIDAPSGEFSILFKTNEIGLRDRPLGTHLRQELKFLFLGDEFVEGWGADIDETAVVNAQRLVNEKTALKPPVRFVIGAKSGYGAAQNLLMAKQLVEQLPIRGIVFVYSALMPHADHRFLARARLEDGLAVGLDPAAGNLLELPHGEDRPPGVAGPLAGIAAKSALASWLAERWAAWRWQREHPAGNVRFDRLAGMRGDAGQLAASHAPTLTHLKAIAALARARDIPFMLIHLPLAPQVAGDEWALGRARFGLPATKQPAPDLALVDAFCETEHLRCLHAHETLVAAADAADGLPLYHPSEIGFNVDGNRVFGAWLGAAMYEWMGQLGLR